MIKTLKLNDKNQKMSKKQSLFRIVSLHDWIKNYDEKIIMLH